MPAWMKTSDWDDHRYALPVYELSQRARLFFRLLDACCGVLRRVRR